MRDVAARSPLALTAHPACRLCLARGPWGISGPIPDPTRTQCIEGGLRCAPPRRPQVTPASTRAAHTWLEQPPPLALSDSAPGWWWSVVSMQPGPRRAGGARASDRTPDPSSQWHRACVALQGINPRGHWLGLGGRHWCALSISSPKSPMTPHCPLASPAPLVEGPTRAAGLA